MLQLLVILLLVPVSSCDTPSHDPDLASHDSQPVSEEEYNAMKLLWEQEHNEVKNHQEVKRSKIKPSYISDHRINDDHHIDMLDITSLASPHTHHLPASHDETQHHKTYEHKQCK